MGWTTLPAWHQMTVRGARAITAALPCCPCIDAHQGLGRRRAWHLPTGAAPPSGGKAAELLLVCCSPTLGQSLRCFMGAADLRCHSSRGGEAPYLLQTGLGTAAGGDSRSHSVGQPPTRQPSTEERSGRRRRRSFSRQQDQYE